MTPDTGDTENFGVGNTKKKGPTPKKCNVKKYRYWIFTWNNYSENNIEYLQNYIKLNCKEGIFQPEVGEQGTPHLQGYLAYENARSLISIKKAISNVIHLEPVKNIEAAKKYCKKEETRNGETFEFSKMESKRKIKDPLENKELYFWQQNIINICQTEPDERKINWYYDEIGGKGKTSLAKHLCLKYPNNVLYISGKCSDIKYGISQFLENKDNDLTIVLLDFCRSTENFISYEGIESVKNGIFYNTKYESKMVIFNNPHVFCFANFKPDESKLSQDRWNIMNINEDNSE